MSVFVKICGIASLEDAKAVALLRPDAMGFIMWPGSKRYAKPGDVAEWVRHLPKNILKVGVFVDASVAEVEEAVRTASLDIIQLHGSESVEAFRGLGAKIWKVIKLGFSEAANLLGSSVDAFLIDTYSSESPGGTGQVGDWESAREWVRRSKVPVFLAGGLNPENVREAIRVVKPWGVDVSSGVEERPGKKDIAKVKAFIEQCRKV